MVPPSSSEGDVLQSEDLVRRFWDRTAHEPDGFEQEGIELDENDASEFSETTNNESTSLPRARTNVEAVMGLFAAFFIGLPAPLVVTAGAMHLPLPNLELVLAISTVIFFSTGYLCVTVVRLAGRAIEGDFAAPRSVLLAVTKQRSSKNDEFYIPLSLAMAIRLPNWWNSVRPFIAIWWLGHFVIAALFGHLAARQLNGINNAGLVTIPITLAVTMAFLFAANLYLMLAIAVSVRLPRIWLVAWRYRFVVDLVVTIAMIANS